MNRQLYVIGQDGREVLAIDNIGEEADIDHFHLEVREVMDIESFLKMSENENWRPYGENITPLQALALAKELVIYGDSEGAARLIWGVTDYHVDMDLAREFVASEPFRTWGGSY